jgi:single-stranded-DNA-specific exonuclease
VLLHRGLRSAEAARAFLDPRLGDLTRPDGMADRALAADRLARAVRAGERVAVFGDYDVDGTTSAAIVADILEALGAEVVVLVGSRFSGGYGFSDAALARVVETGATLLVTCDCGSSDHPRLHEARRRGVDAIVVDHHLVPDEPLPALAFLNPHRSECGFPYKHLTSTGLALSLGAAVRAALGARLDLRAWLDLVALGTVADVGVLDGDNRRLVRAGLQALGAPDVRPGIAALRETARLRPGVAMTSRDVAFKLAPRLNAAGRMGDPSIALALLRARTMEEAKTAAAAVERLNEERRAIEQRVTAEAIAQVEEIYGPRPTRGVVAAGEGWHRGVVGITAARLVDRFGVPAVVVAIEDGVGHGSARAPEGAKLHDVVARCAATLERFGGHQAAVGLTLRANRVEALRAAFSDATAVAGAPPGLAATEDAAEGGPRQAPCVVDVVLDGAAFGVPSAADLARLEPLGLGNEEPRFALVAAKVERAAVVGDRHLRLALRVGRDRIEAFGYDMGNRLDGLGYVVDVVGALGPNGYRGGDSVEMRIVDV